MPLTAKRPSQRLLDIVAALRGEWSGYRAMCRCPVHADNDPSLSLRQGDKGILVHCFAGCHSTDILRELRHLRPTQPGEMPRGPGQGGTANVDQLWEGALPISGTLAERYLGLRKLLPAPADLRYHPRCPYLPRPRTKFLPALLVPVRSGRKLLAIQRIFLDPATARYTFKVMLGRPLDASWRGGQPTSVLAIAEGFETAQAFSLLHDIPCWASLGAGRLPQLSLPTGITRLILAEDNDAEGRAAALKASEAYARPDLEITRAPPPHRMKDWAKVAERA